jgi:O-antigen/teichoic acid export membrane protein
LVSIGLGLAWWFSWEVRYFWLWLAIGYLLQIALIVYLLRRDLPPLRRPSRGELDWPKMFRYSLLLTLTGSAMILVSKIDIIMIENMIGPEEVAFYFLAFFIAKFITTPGRSLVTGMRGSVAQAWKKNDLDLLSTIYQKSAAYQTLSTTFLFLGVALFYPFLELFMKAEFQGLYALFFWLGLGQWVTTSSGINAMIIALSNRYQWNFYVNIALLIITPVLNLLLIPQFGLLGAAVATFVSLTITNILRFWMVKKLFGLLPYLGSNRSLFFINILSISVAGILTAYDMPWWMRFSIMGLLVLSSFWQVQHFSIFEDLIKIFTRLGKNKT